MREFVSNLKGVWKYIKSDKKSLIILIFEHILQIGISIVLPILSAKILIELTSNEYMRILGVAIVMLIVDLINNTNRYVMNRISARLYRNIMSRLEVHLGKCVLKIGNDSLDKNSNGVFIQRMTGDTSKLADIFNNLIGNVSSYIEYIGILVAIFVVNKLVFIYVLFFAVILYVLEDIRTKMKKQDDKEFRKSKEKVSGFIGELVRGARDIKMLNSEKDFTNELSTRIDDCNEKMFSLQKRNQKYRVLMWDISSLGNFILIVLLVLLLKDKILIPSIALVLYNYSGKISSSAYFVGNFLEQIKDFNLSAERVFAITNGDEFKKEKFGNVHLDKVNGNFEFKDVIFAYSTKKVLNKLSFKINANETVAFVGKSGAGSTITVIYNYIKNNGEITENDVTKLQKNQITDINSEYNYVLNYNGKIENYVGEVTLELTDILPYNVVITSMDKRCTLDGKVITCKETYNIDENNQVINESFDIKLRYTNIGSEVTNKVESRLIYGNNEITDEDKVTDKVPYGVVIATYKDTNGNELTTEVKTIDLVGKEYNTEEKDFFGYSLKEINGNENGTYIDDTIYVEYIYTNTMGTGDIEELPPQTGVEQNNLYNYLIIISMLVLSVRGYKKVKETL